MTEHLAKPLLALGFMSGTSADGIDCAAIRTDGDVVFEFLGAVTKPYDDRFRQRLLQAASSDVGLTELLLLERELTARHAEAGTLLLDDLKIATESVDVVGFHGHTVRHIPECRLTWQIGNASQLAHALGATVVNDFRRRDMANGGEGAPLAPLFHAMLLRDRPKPAAIVNIGGVANVSWFGGDGRIVAGDSGPGCCLIDAWTQKHFDLKYDRDAKFASEGQIHYDRLDELLQASFFNKPLPKSADRFDFDATLLDGLHPHDGLATLCALTAKSIAAILKQLPEPTCEVWITGGGARNPLIMTLLAAEGSRVACIDELNLRSESLEAECFAWLAVRALRGLPLSVPGTTGCAEASTGGMITAG